MHLLQRLQLFLPVRRRQIRCSLLSVPCPPDSGPVIPDGISLSAGSGENRHYPILQETVFPCTDTSACVSADLRGTADALGRPDLGGCRKGTTQLLHQFPSIGFASMVRVHASRTIPHNACHLPLAGPTQLQ